MYKGENTLLIWLLSWGVVLVALMYSPLGSPDLYKNRKYYTDSQGVNFNRTDINKGITGINKGIKDLGSLRENVASLKETVGFLKQVKNAPKDGKSNQNSDHELNVSVENRTKKHGYNYSVNTTCKSLSSNTSYPVNNESDDESSSAGVDGSNFESIRSEVNNGNAGSGNTHTSNTGINVGQAQPTNVDMTIFSDSTSILLASNQPQKADGFLDPGAGDPTSPPVPVPDGFWFLITMALAYGAFICYKKKLFSKKQSTQV